MALCTPTGKLRVRGLVETEDAAELGWPLPSDLVLPGRGLHLHSDAFGQKLADDFTLFCSQAPGIRYMPSPSTATAWAKDLVEEPPPPAIAEVVRQHLSAPHAVVLWLDGVLLEQIAPLAQAVGSRLQRPVVCIDGAALCGFPHLQLLRALRRLRRDADLRGAAVVVSEVDRLADAWPALCQPRPSGQTAPLLLCSQKLRGPLGRPPIGQSDEKALISIFASLLPGTAQGAAATSAAGGVPAEDPATLASREEARRRAALDAARAMGRPIPPELLENSSNSAASFAPARKAEQSAPAPSSLAARAPATGPASPPASQSVPAAPAPTAETEATTAPASAPSGRVHNPRLAAALAKAGVSVPGSSEDSPPEYARRLAEEPVAPLPAKIPELPPPSPPTIATSAAALVAVAQPASAGASAEENAEDPPPLPIDESAPLDEALRVARTTPNNAQRISLMQRLATTKSPGVIQLFRMSLSSSHAGVRAAAEVGMATLFGPGWNRTKAIVAPIQPPRSDDGGRGPGGAF